MTMMLGPVKKKEAPAEKQSSEDGSPAPAGATAQA
jgi:hypothetical protein